MRDVGIGGEEGIADRRPKHPAVGFDLFDVHRIAVVGDCEKAAELRFWVVDENRDEKFALVADQDRAVVGDEFGK